MGVFGLYGVLALAETIGDPTGLCFALVSRKIMQPGQMTQTEQQDIPNHMAFAQVKKIRERRKKEDTH